MRLGIVFVLALAVLAGCGRSSGPFGKADRAASPSAATEAMAPQASAPSAGGGAAPPRPAPAAAHAHMIIRSAEMKIVAADPAATLRAVSARVEGRGGFVADSKQWREAGRAHATLTLRVPAGQIFATLAEIRAAALRTETENVSGQDVSQEYTDLSAELTNLEATERELRQLLATVRQRTQRASDVLEVFNQLAKVRGEIDQTRGRLLNLGQLVDLATITLDIAPDAVAAPPVEDVWRPGGVARDALRTLVTTLKWVCDVLIWVCIYIAPLAALIAALVVLVRRAVRRAARLKKDDPAVRPDTAR